MDIWGWYTKPRRYKHGPREERIARIGGLIIFGLIILLIIYGFVSGGVGDDYSRLCNEFHDCP